MRIEEQRTAQNLLAYRKSGAVSIRLTNCLSVIPAARNSPESQVPSPKSRIPDLKPLILCLILSACGSVPTRDSPPPVARAPESSPAPPRPVPPRGGGYYLDDGPGDNPPANLEQSPDAVPKREALARGAMRPYNVMGQNYTPMTSVQPYKARGVASWYGRRYHGRQTSSGEIYDMYAMTAAHTILPLPSYARVTNLANNKSIVVRINDRGPFHSDRLIDLSYTAAYKLGVLGGGRAMVEVETIIPGANAPVVAVAPRPAPAAPIATATPLDPPALPAALALPASDPDSPPPAAVMIAYHKGLFLQLGAFGSQENAENYLARLRSQIDWLATALHVYPGDGLFRVHAGPYATQSEARTAADRISQALGIKPMVLTR